jgi:hypothetical protein
MAKRRKMADGGMVDINENNKEQPNKYYQANREALDWGPDDDQLDAQPLESIGDSEEESAENDHDESMVDAIRRKMRMKSPIIR